MKKKAKKAKELKKSAMGQYVGGGQYIGGFPQY